MEDFHAGSHLNASEPMSDGTSRATLRCRLHRRHHREFLNELAKLPEVKTIKELSP